MIGADFRESSDLHGVCALCFLRSYPALDPA